MTKRRKFLLSIFLFFALFFVIIVYCNKEVEDASNGKLYSNVNNIPENHTGLLLGTTKYLADGNLNPYYEYRIEAAVQLIKASKIKYLVISGDNSRKDYNEPGMMKSDLIAAGVDSNRIYLDFAGLLNLI